MIENDLFMAGDIRPAAKGVNALKVAAKGWR